MDYFIIFRCPICGLGTEMVIEGNEFYFRCEKHKKLSWEQVRRCTEILREQELHKTPVACIKYPFSPHFFQ